jgi:predicted alternative tryptophan synthase beta-subunit
MRAAGFEPEDYEGDFVEVWPENLPALEMFQRIGTRWVPGMAGVVGIRWEAVYPLIDRLGLEGDAWDQMVSDLEVMEHAALAVMNKRD